jgi:hypothetical protein
MANKPKASSQYVPGSGIGAPSQKFELPAVFRLPRVDG